MHHTWHHINPNGKFDTIPDQSKTCFILLEDGTPCGVPIVIRGTYDKDAGSWYCSFAGKLTDIEPHYKIVSWRYEG